MRCTTTCARHTLWWGCRRCFWCDCRRQQHAHHFRCVVGACLCVERCRLCRACSNLCDSTGGCHVMVQATELHSTSPHTHTHPSSCAGTPSAASSAATCAAVVSASIGKRMPACRRDTPYDAHPLHIIPVLPSTPQQPYQVVHMCWAAHGGRPPWRALPPVQGVPGPLLPPLHNARPTQASCRLMQALHLACEYGGTCVGT